MKAQLSFFSAVAAATLFGVDLAAQEQRGAVVTSIVTDSLKVHTVPSISSTVYCISPYGKT